MNKLDDAIKDALSKEDAAFLASLEQEPGAIQQMVGIFQGPFSPFYVLFFIAAVAVGIVGVYAGWRFAISTDLRPLFYWGAITGFCLVVLAVVRVLFFMQINTNRVLRELKRLELQVARLAAKDSRHS
jgi:uncharacterized membrane protein YciS (DUF1049 family)